MPRLNFFIIKRLSEHLDHVTEYETTNNMVASNLAIVFGPTLIRPPYMEWYYDHPDVPMPADAGNPMRHLGRCNAIVKLLILHHHWLFDLVVEIPMISTEAPATADSMRMQEGVTPLEEDNPFLERVLTGDDAK
jgi:hypothetical protein